MLDKAPNQKISSLLRSLDQALVSDDVECATNLFQTDCYWRDLVAFTWNIKTMTTSLWTKPIRRRSKPSARMKALYAVKATSMPVPSGRSSENASCPRCLECASAVDLQQSLDAIAEDGGGLLRRLAIDGRHAPQRPFHLAAAVGVRE